MFKNSVFRKTTDTGKWFAAAGIRAAKTMAQSALALLPVSAAVYEVDWKLVAGTAALAGVASLLTSAAGLPEVKRTEGM